MRPYLVLKDKKRRRRFEPIEINVLALKTLMKNQHFDPIIKEWLMFKTSNLSSSHYYSRIKNFCILSSKSKGIFQRFGGLSRMMLKFLFAGGFFYGWERF